MTRRSSLRALIGIALCLPFVLHCLGELRLPALERLELLAYDARLLLALPGGMDTRIVIVDVDERSLAAEGQWPWPRDRLASLVRKLGADYGVRVIGIDSVFPEPDRFSDARAPADDPPAAGASRAPTGPDYDGQLAASFALRPVVLGYAFRPEPTVAGALPEPLFKAQSHGTRIDFIEAAGYTANLPRLQAAASGAGFFDNPTVDPDGVYRRVPLLQRYRGDLYQSFALAVVRAALASPPLEFSFHGGPDGPRDGLDLDWLSLGELRIPVDARAVVLVPYRGPQGSFPYVSATDVLSGRAPQHPLRGAIALVGTSATGLRDIRVAPVGRSFSGVEVHANLISGILQQSVKQSPRYVLGMELTALAVVALLITSVMARASMLAACLALVLIEVALAAVALQLWQRAGLVMPVAGPMLLAFLLFVAQLLYGYFVETRRQRVLSTLFGQYVPPELVAQMARNPERYSAESACREMTVLFADVRNFTRIAEGLEPRELSALMNELLTALTRAIHRNGGTIDKYIGDAVMAFWGAPLPDPAHAARAVQAGIEMVGALAELAPRLRERGWPTLTIGIGINSGIMRVGHMGSEFRQAYTVMGDAVNLAARIEGLTKLYDVHLAVGEATMAAAPVVAFLELDRVRVQGRAEPVSVYEPLGARGELPAALRRMRERHTAALEAYRRRDWDAAERDFFALHQSHPERALFRIYLDRVAAHRMHPPAHAWDGAFEYALK